MNPDLDKHLSKFPPLRADEPGEGVGKTEPFDSFRQLESEHGEWADATFPSETLEAKVAHLLKEAKELSEHPSDPQEMADCFLLAINIARKAGVDILAVSRAKFEVCKQRTWEKKSDGTFGHVKPIAGATPPEDRGPTEQELEEYMEWKRQHHAEGEDHEPDEVRIIPPKGHEILTSKFLREHGAVEGMNFWQYNNKPPTWERSSYRLNDHLRERDLHPPVVYCALLGTMAAILTPAPTGFQNVLPGWLAEQKEKPKGLVWAIAQNNDWEPMSDTAWDTIVNPNKDTYRFAYAVPISTQTRKEGDGKWPLVQSAEINTSPDVAVGCTAAPAEVPSSAELVALIMSRFCDPSKWPLTDGERITMLRELYRMAQRIHAMELREEATK